MSETYSNIPIVAESSIWGQITGVLANQTDLQSALDDLQTQIDDKLPDTGVGLVEQLSGMIETPIDKTYTLDLYASYAYTINTLKIITVSGTCTAAIKINATAVTGISAVSVTSSIATGTASAANSVAIGDKVSLVISSSSSPADLGFTLKFTRV